ncbi:MAG: YlxR family protein [Lachnospiraceae bacterium]
MTKKIPLRQCVGCRQMESKKNMIRVIKTADDEILVDVTGKMNGRGAYLCKSSQCLNLALKNKGLERSLKIRIPMEVVTNLTKEMELIEAR